MAKAKVLRTALTPNVDVGHILDSDWLAKVLNQEGCTPFDYGAVGDGVAVDTVAVQKAFDEGMTILPRYSPAGVPFPSFLVDQPIQLAGDDQILMSHPGCTLKAAAAHPVLQLGNGFGGSRKKNQMVFLPRIDGNGVATAGVQSNGVKDLTAIGGHILNCNGPGIEWLRTGSGGDFGLNFIGATVRFCTYALKGHGDNNQSSIIDPHFESCSLGGVLLDADGTNGSIRVRLQGGYVQWCGPFGIGLNYGTTGFDINTYIELGQPASSETTGPGNDIATDRAIKYGMGGPVGAGRISIYGKTQAGVATHMIQALNTCDHLELVGNLASNFATHTFTGTEPVSSRWAGNNRNGNRDYMPSTWTKGWESEPDNSRIPGVLHFTTAAQANSISAGTGVNTPAKVGTVLLVEIDGVGRVGIPCYPVP